MAGWHRTVLGAPAADTCQLARESQSLATAGTVPLSTANAAGIEREGAGIPLPSWEPVLDVTAPRLAQHLLNAAVGWERKRWKMKEIVEEIKNVTSNKALK